ncbi:MAG: ribose 5-phosphate isomerase B [Oscillospiraceae bacterium]|nr:ribose 5-phosphate isomerase B [Oscillospiraceae bacterium]
MSIFQKGEILAIGCDHGGYELKQKIMEHLKEKEIEVKDFGTYSSASVDYPDIALKVSKSVVSGEAKLGILICGTGIGMSLAANKVHGIRAAACSETFSAKYTRLHNDANILCLGGRVVGDGVAMEIVDLFVDTPFEGGRHQRRVDAVMDIEKL